MIVTFDAMTLDWYFQRRIIQTELNLGASLNHSNIVQLFGSVTYENGLLVNDILSNGSCSLDISRYL